MYAYIEHYLKSEVVVLLCPFFVPYSTGGT